MSDDQPSDVVLATLVRDLADAVVIADARGTITFWNGAAAELFGWSTEEAVGQTLDLIIPDARIKYLSGAITEEQLRAEVKRWYDSGGTQVAQEVNDLVSKVGN